MTTPITDLLGQTMDGVTRHLRDHYILNRSENDRIKRARERANLYRGAGDELICDYIEAVFDDRRVQELRKRYVDVAKYNNVTQRIVDEIATLYNKAPKRRVDGDTNDARYQKFLRDAKQNQKMRRANRMLDLHRQILVGFRVWKDDIDRQRHSIHVVTPDAFWAVRHPDDPQWAIAFIVDLSPQVAEDVVPDSSVARYMVWTNHETFKLNHSGLLIEGTYDAHGFERMPWLLASADESEGPLLDNYEGEDLTAAHKSVWFENVMLLKESGSQNKQTAFTGDTRTTPTGQSADSQFDIMLGDGVGVQTIDRGVDLQQYMDTGDHIFEHAGANKGIPPSVLKHQGATSGFEIQLRRIGIRERRIEQEPVFRALERDLADVESMVLAKDDPAAAFTTKGWSINYAVTETPMNRTEQLDVFERERRLGLSNTRDMINRDDPDLTPEGAFMRMLENIDFETLRNLLMRPIQQISGSMGAETPSIEQDAGDEPDTQTSLAVNGRAQTATTAQVGGN